MSQIILCKRFVFLELFGFSRKIFMDDLLVFRVLFIPVSQLLTRTRKLVKKSWHSRAKTSK